MGLDDSKAFSESLRKELFARLKSKWRPFCRPPPLGQHRGRQRPPKGWQSHSRYNWGYELKTPDFSEFSKLRGVIQV